MSNAVSENGTTDTGTNLGEEDIIGENIDNNSRSIKEEVIVPEIIDKAVEEVNENELLVPTAVADSDIAQTKAKKKSTLSKVGKGLASIIASI